MIGSLSLSLFLVFLNRSVTPSSFYHFWRPLGHGFIPFLLSSSSSVLLLRLSHSPCPSLSTQPSFTHSRTHARTHTHIHTHINTQTYTHTHTRTQQSDIPL